VKQFIDHKLQQVNFLDERYYKRYPEASNEVYYPSFSYVLGIYPKGDQFIQWLKDVGNNAKIIADRAKESGSKVHHAINKIILKDYPTWCKPKGSEYDLDNPLYMEHEWQGILRFIDFYDNFNPETVVSEYNVFSDILKAAGTLDYLPMIDGVRWLIDHKFSNAIYPSHFLQSVGYAESWNEMFPDLKIDKIGILHLKAHTRGRDSKGKRIQGEGWQLIEPKHYFTKIIKNLNIKSEQELYNILKKKLLSILDIWHFEHPIVKPKNRIYPMIAKPKRDCYVEKKAV
jgi:hypothetical protein